MKREEILQIAEGVSSDRNETHGDFTKNMIHTRRLLVAANLGTEDWHAPLMLALVKISRMRCGKPHPDHFIDAANYIAQAGAMACKMTPPAGKCEHEYELVGLSHNRSTYTCKFCNDTYSASPGGS